MSADIHEREPFYPDSVNGSQRVDPLNLPTSPAIAILAGNSRLSVDADGTIGVEAQLRAFEAALSVAANHRTRYGKLPPISVAFDHRGIFRLQFLAPDLTNSQRRNPRLSNLKTEIVSVFAALTDFYDIPTDRILVIHEDSARSHLDHVLRTETLPEAVRQRMVSPGGTDEKSGGSCAIDGHAGPKLTCAAITREYFVKASQQGAEDENSTLEVFYEDDKWSETLAYIRGLQMTKWLGAKNRIRLNLVEKDGTVHSGGFGSSR